MPTPPHNFSRRNPKNGPRKPVSPATPDANLETDRGHLKVYDLAKLLKNKAPSIPHGGKAPANLADFLVPWFEKNVEKPAQQLAGVSEAWIAHVPPKLVARTRLISYSRGTLTVAADHPTVKAELEAALRGSLQNTLKTALRGAFFRVKVLVIAPEIPEIS